MIIETSGVGRNEIFSSVPVALVSTGCSGCTSPTVLVGSPRLGFRHVLGTQLGSLWWQVWQHCGSGWWFEC